MSDDSFTIDRSGVFARDTLRTFYYPFHLHFSAATYEEDM
jgi:hypothetical protein